MSDKITKEYIEICINHCKAGGKVLVKFCRRGSTRMAAASGILTLSDFDNGADYALMRQHPIYLFHDEIIEIKKRPIETCEFDEYLDKLVRVQLKDLTTRTGILKRSRTPNRYRVHERDGRSRYVYASRIEKIYPLGVNPQNGYPTSIPSTRYEGVYTPPKQPYSVGTAQEPVLINSVADMKAAFQGPIAHQVASTKKVLYDEVSTQLKGLLMNPELTRAEIDNMINEAKNKIAHLCTSMPKIWFDEVEHCLRVECELKEPKTFVKVDVPTKDLKDMQSTIKETLREVVVIIEAPGANAENTTIDVDTDTNIIHFGCTDKEVKVSPKEVGIKERYNIEKAKAEIKDGIIKITVPTKEGTVKSIQPE